MTSSSSEEDLSSGIIGKIYKLTSNETDDIYIGGTTGKLNIRFNTHKCNYKQYLNDKRRYETAFELTKYNDVKIELLYENEFKTVKDMYNLEGEYIKNNKNCVNMRITGRDKKEYNKQYRENNVEKEKERHKKYCDDNKE